MTNAEATKKYTNAELTKKYKEFLYPSVITYYAEPLPLVSGKGCRVYDAEGNEYLDFFGGIPTVSLGHCHEPIAAAVAEQLGVTAPAAPPGCRATWTI